MGLIGNNFRLNTGSHRSLGEVMSRTNGNYQRYSSFCNTRSQMGNTVVYALTSIPAGANPKTSFYSPQEAGAMSMRSFSSGSITFSMVPVKLMSSDFLGLGDLVGTASLTVSMLCDMISSGTLTADIVGILNISADLIGEGDLSADIKGVAEMLLNLMGEGGLSADIGGYGDMSIDIIVTGAGLTTANVGQAVFAALATLNNIPGTMGAKVNSAASAGDPWSTQLPGSYTGDEAGKIVADLELLIKQVKALTSAGL